MSVHTLERSMEITASDCTYTSCYCEENVWKLCEKLQSHGKLDALHVVFISNHNRMIPLWCQRAANPPDFMVVWDYHVILLETLNKPSVEVIVWDLDTRLSFPVSFREYAKQAIHPRDIPARFQQLFRVVKGADYLQTFASDRSHMINPDGSWKSPPPDYAPIHTQDCKNNIQEFISMNPAAKAPGNIMTYQQLVEQFFMIKFL